MEMWRIQGAHCPMKGTTFNAGGHSRRNEKRFPGAETSDVKEALLDKVRNRKNTE